MTSMNNYIEDTEISPLDTTSGDDKVELDGQLAGHFGSYTSATPKEASADWEIESSQESEKEGEWIECSNDLGDHTSLPPYRGFVDSINRSGVCGWCIDIRHPSKVVELQVSFLGIDLASGVTGGHRPDLEDVLASPCYGGFTVDWSTVRIDHDVALRLWNRVSAAPNDHAAIIVRTVDGDLALQCAQSGPQVTNAQIYQALSIPFVDDVRWSIHGQKIYCSFISLMNEQIDLDLRFNGNVIQNQHITVKNGKYYSFYFKVPDDLAEDETHTVEIVIPTGSGHVLAKTTIQKIQEICRSEKVEETLERLEKLLAENPHDIVLLKELTDVKLSIKNDYCAVIKGHFDGIRDRAVDGWAWQCSVPGERLPIRVLVDGVEVAQGIADLHRPDLQAAGFGDCSYHILLPENVFDGGSHEVSVLGPDGAHLIGSPARFVFQEAHYYVNRSAPLRLPIKEMIGKLAAYDVISFDVFDTAIVRAVSAPTDVFRIMGSRLGVTDFVRKRKNAEAYARTRNDHLKGTREVTLHDIYEVLAERTGATAEWEQLEKDIEIQLARQNPYIFQVYEQLQAMGKTLIFTSDMYLPKETLQAMLARAGYSGYESIYLSNEHNARKGDGTLQRVLIADYGSKGSIVHVGDVYEADVEKSIAAGIAALHNPDRRSQLTREKDMASLAGSFYEAVIDNALGTGMWSEGLHYTHGFRTGGILALGYVEFLDRLARDKGVEKILFLGRDCRILSQIYRRFFGTLPSEYVGTSRYASLMLTAERNFEDYIGRTFFRWYKESNNSRPLSQLLIDTGFEYLIEHLESADIEPLEFPISANEGRLREFFWTKKSVVEAHLTEMRMIARDYFATALGGAQKVLVVDIGWTGSCITTLRDFFQISFADRAPKIFGALLVTSRDQQIVDAISDGSISAYVYSPVLNQDITRLMMPGNNIPQKSKDLLTHPVEYLFTEAKPTTIGYARDATGKSVTVQGSNVPPNSEQILDMQRGVMDFVERYLEYSEGLADLRLIGSYTAFQPLRNTLGHKHYIYEVYKDFLYDAVPALHGDAKVFERFGNLFGLAVQRAAIGATEAGGQAITTRVPLPRILFVSYEMNYVGAPRSLLRLCKVAMELGYEPMVWTVKPGPFAREFEAQGFPVYVVLAKEVDKQKIDVLIRDNVKLVVCNTVITDEYVQVFEGKLPVVWYVREATNVPQFLRENSKRADTLRRSSSVVVVSDYAAQAVAMYTDGPVDVVKNAVEDLRELALPYVPAKDGVVRFIQLGTIEHRKGYDLFVAAYKAMPEEYRARAELHFAGGFINSQTSFASYLFGQFREVPEIHYHGVITDERRKIELISQMDVVVVASRDESCSLVALEGTMLSKPLIVTENVGAKYMVGDENGIVVPSGDIAALRDAFMRMIDRSPDQLIAMGAVSRRNYDKLASMNVHRQELGRLFLSRIIAGPEKSNSAVAQAVNSPVPSNPTRELIVSLTSFPPRMPTIPGCIRSLKLQTKRPDRIVLWLSADQFPAPEAQLPAELLELVDRQFEIRWVTGDLAPHKKYFYAMQEFPHALVVTVDDDVQYDKDLVGTLYQGHLDRPHCVVAGRSHLIRFRPDGALRTYNHWGYDHRHLRETETFALLPTGIGGVLYPPGSVPAEAFDADAIAVTCLHTDDLWLKVHTTANGYPVWMPRRTFEYPNINGSQGAALWQRNVFQNGNDLAMKSIMEFFEQKHGTADAVLRRIWGVRADGSFVGPGDEIDRSPLLVGKD